MNERNVEALVKLLVAEAGASTYLVRNLAERLASRGVLVPGALTPEQCDEVFDAAMHVYHLDGPEPELEQPMVVSPPGYAWDWECGPLTMALERIARGAD